MDPTKERFFIVLHGKSKKGFCRGCIGSVTAEPQRGMLHGLVYSNMGPPKDGGAVKKEDTYPLTRQQAQLLLFISSTSKRLELLCKPQLFAAICELSKDDLVVMHHKKGCMAGLVKNIVQIGRKDNQDDLSMLGFEVECVDHDINLSSKKPAPLHVFNAADILQVVSTYAPPLELQWKDGNYGSLNRRVGAPINATPNQGSHVRQVRETKTEQSASRAPLGVGSAVEVVSNTGITVYGVIQWVGVLTGKTSVWAGVELDYEVRGCSNGSYGGQRYFTCKGNRGLFVPITKCNPDNRLICRSTQRRTPIFFERLPVTPYDEAQEDAPPVAESEVSSLLVGRMKGIQGDVNSCYLDATLFSLFTSAINLDECQNPAEMELPKNRALREIVNRLRRQGFVPAKTVMNFRELLGSETFCTEEKDPEEFITVLFKNVLGHEPLLTLRSNEEESHGAYTLQIILEKQQMGQMPTVQQLLDTSCLSVDLKFEKVPSLLMIQMPRFGNNFKMFSHIIPTTELDITNVLTNVPRECYVCGQVAVYECLNCLPDSKMQPGRIKQYCAQCDRQVHMHPSRQGHAPRALALPEGVDFGASVPKHTMQLFAVLCIRTSHYVAFVKYGPNPNSWVFFDSMADRRGNDQHGYNIPEIRICSEIGDFLSQQPEDLVQCGNLPEFVERLVCDSYMFLYQNPDMPLSTI